MNWITKMPSNRTPMWLARGAIAALVVLFLILSTGGLKVSSSTVGNTTVYSSTPLSSIIFAILGIIIGVLAVVFWMQRAVFYRAVALFLALMALYQLFNAPTGLNHGLVVTPDYFRLTVGRWYSPEVTRVEFGSLAELSVLKTGDAGYELQCNTKTGNSINVPIYDPMKKGLPEVFQRAAERGVLIVKGPDGLQIPAALRE